MTGEHVYRAEFASGCRAELLIGATGARIEWSPRFPSELRGQRRRKFLQSYRAWRYDCLFDHSRRTGARVLVLDR
jgi:hypothetical protein